MSTPVPTESPEAEIAREVERIKQTAQGTRDVYRQVCQLLFVRYGETPTGNRLYQLVRKGTMSTPSEVLREFWADVRAKVRLQIDRKDMRPDLAEFAADMVSALWAKACVEADESVAAARAQVQADRAEADATVLRTREETERAHAAKVHAETLLEDVRGEIRLIESRLAVAQEARRSLEEDNAALRTALEARTGALDAARADFAAEIDKLRTDAAQSAARYEAAERRALLEIDRERTAAAALQRTLDEVRARAAREEDGWRRELAAARAQIADERHRSGQMEGQLDALVRPHRYRRLPGVRGASPAPLAGNPPGQRRPGLAGQQRRPARRLSARSR